MSAPLRVAIIGISGIGKNHAHWFETHGCQVCAFVGSSAESVARAGETLSKNIGIEATGYSDLGEMLESEHPDAVCVASPPWLHHQHVLQSLAAGVHVLCEKPMVYDPDLAHDDLRRHTRDMVNEAARRGLLLGIQMQYAVGVEPLLKLSGFDPATAAPHSFSMEMETKNLKHGSSFDATWIDLSPHPLSVLQKLAPGATMDTSSIACRVEERQTSATFRVVRLDGSPVEAAVTVRFNPAAAAPLRRFTIDGRVVDYAGRKDDSGEFRTYLTGEDGATVMLPDFADSLIGQFAAACRGEGVPAVSGEEGAQNVDWQLAILAAGTSTGA